MGTITKEERGQVEGTGREEEIEGEGASVKVQKRRRGGEKEQG